VNAWISFLQYLIDKCIAFYLNMSLSHSHQKYSFQNNNPPNFWFIQVKDLHHLENVSVCTNVFRHFQEEELLLSSGLPACGLTFY
jgi:hypothetical protein